MTLPRGSHDDITRAAFAATLWSQVYAGLTAATFSDKGESAVHELHHKILTRHQGALFTQGMVKLGIESDPPAVAAAKYHYLTNIIGGLRMQYIEESSKKVWIRYLGPMWTYPGVAMLAMPSRLRRTILSAWHPRDGHYMGAPSLQWVSTKFVMEGDPYDEGYFIEREHPLEPDDRVAFESVRNSPEFNPDQAPVLDVQEWPAARMAKAKRNFSEGYARQTVQTLVSMYGELGAYALLRRTMRCLAVQQVEQLAADLGKGSRTFEGVVDFWTAFLSASFQEFDIERVGPHRYLINLHSFRPFPDADETLRSAMFEFQVTGTRMLNGHIRVTRRRMSITRPEETFGEIWEFVDEGRWLW